MKYTVSTELDNGPGPAASLAWAPDRDILAAASYGRVKLWSAETFEILAVLEGHTNYIWDVAWSPADSTLASASQDETVRLWNPKTHTQLATLNVGQWTFCVAWSPDGSQLASGDYAGDINVWDVRSGELLLRLTSGDSWPVIAMDWSPDGRILAWGHVSGATYLWNMETGEQLTCLVIDPKTRSDINGLAWSNEGRILAVGQAAPGESGKVRLWKPDTEELLSTLEGHTGWVRGVAWSPDGRRLASTSEDTTIRLWDAETGQLQTILGAHSRPVWSVVWSPDGSRLAAGSGLYQSKAPGAIIVWAVSFL